MRHVRLLVCALLLLSFPRPAHAQSDFWDWLESFSGPGPFQSHFRTINSRGFCTLRGGEQKIDWWCGDDTRRDIREVLTAEVAWPDSDSNRRFADGAGDPLNNAPVRATRVVVNYYYRVHPVLDVGVGAGALTFSGEGFENQVHPILAPLNVTFTPFGFVHGESRTVAKWGRLLRFKIAERYVLGDIRAQDFNSLKSTYARSGEWNFNYSVSFDLWPFIDQRMSNRKP
jgi:hypothetical protein